MAIFGIPFEFVLFAATLVGVAVFHNRTLTVALCGLAAITLYKFAFSGFNGSPGLAGLGAHLALEWVILANLGLLLTGFAILTRHFEQSNLPDLAPDILPDDWKGGLVLLALVGVLSAFLDNIAAAANASGAGSVVGDTTTTMMWIAGKSPLDVLSAYVAAGAAFAVFAIPAAIAQQKHQPVLKHHMGDVRPDWARIRIVVAILIAAVAANVAMNIAAPQLADLFPVIGAALWAALLGCAFVRPTDWSVLPAAAKGALFLLALVLSASLMPVEALPAAQWTTTFVLGLLSAVFDNIPLTALALEQGGYDWGMLAYAVGFGGSMIWFGSSAGVGVSNLFPEAKSAIAWLRAGWTVALAYVVGFFVMLVLLGWRPAP